MVQCTYTCSNPLSRLRPVFVIMTVTMMLDLTNNDDYNTTKNNRTDHNPTDPEYKR